MPVPQDNSPFGYRAPGAANSNGQKPNVLFVSMGCHHCESAFKIASLPKYAPHVEIVDVTESAETYKRMVDANVFQTPQMTTPKGVIAGGERIAEYLRETYG